MRHIFLSFVILLVLTGCGDQATKSKSASNNFEPANNQNNPSNNPANNQGQANNGGNNSLSMMERYGTEGPEDDSAKSPGGNAVCDLGSIKTDDLDGEANSSVPPRPWDGPIGDEPARCGDDFETTVWRLMNCERMARGMNPYECDLRLVWLGRAHSQDMIDRGFFSHDNPDNESPFERMAEVGIESRASAENIAQNGSAEGAHLSWMDSSGHRSNMLGPYSHAGTGFVGNLYTTGFITVRE